MTRSYLALVPVVISLLAACAGSPFAVARMTPEQISAVSNKDLCFAYDKGQDQTGTVREEVARRQVDCSRVLLQAGLEPRGAARAGGTSSQSSSVVGRTGVKITNSPSSECEGIEVTGAEERQFGAVGVVGHFVFINNVSGRRKTVTLDIKYFIDGKQGAFLNIPSAEHWEQSRPLVMRADERSLVFPVKSQKSPRDKIVAVTVLSCQ